LSTSSVSCHQPRRSSPLICGKAIGRSFNLHRAGNSRSRKYDVYYLKKLRFSKNPTVRRTQDSSRLFSAVTLHWLEEHVTLAPAEKVPLVNPRENHRRSQDPNLPPQERVSSILEARFTA
jgi:hypothetical protein